MPLEYTINIPERVRELLGDRMVPNTAEIEYSFNGGYEKLSSKMMCVEIPVTA